MDQCKPLESGRNNRRILRKMLNSKCKKSFERWVDMVQEAKETRVLLSRCAKKILNRALAGRGLHSSTSHLNLSRGRSLKPQRASTSQLTLRRFCQ